MEVEYIPLSLIDDYEMNSNTHPESQLAQISVLLVDIGWTVPVLMRPKEGGRFELIAGHGRKEAGARVFASGGSLKMASGEVIPEGTIPSVMAIGWSDEQIASYVIADNQISRNSVYDEDILARELAKLAAADFDLSHTGFDSSSIDSLLASLGEDTGPKKNKDECPDLELEKPSICKAGEIYKLGNHRLMCGSSIESKNIKSLLGSIGREKADMVFTDPPYLMNFTGSMKGDGTKSANGNHKVIANDNLGKKEGDEFLLAVSMIIKEFCLGSWYICFYRLGIDWIIDAVKGAGMKWRNLIIWNKGALTLSNSDYKSTYEPIVFGFENDYEPVLYGWNEAHNFHGPKGEVDIWAFDGEMLSVWEIARTRRNDLHPTMKPVALCERAIKNSSKHGEVVLDMFGGSGSTMIACESLGRKSCLVELDPHYCDVIIRRWQEFTGKEAVSLASSKTFKESEQNSVTA